MNLLRNRKYNVRKNGLFLFEAYALVKQRPRVLSSQTRPWWQFQIASVESFISKG